MEEIKSVKLSQAKDIPAKNWTYDDLCTNDVKVVFRRCHYNFSTSIDL